MTILIFKKLYPPLVLADNPREVFTANTQGGIASILYFVPVSIYGKGDDMGELLPTKTKQEATLLDTSILAFVGAAAVAGLYPAYLPLSLLMGGFGALGIANYAFTWSKFDRLFKNLNLCKGGSYPILNNTEETETSRIYKFTLPAGLSSEDFERNRVAIKQHLGRDIDIRYTYKSVWIEVFESQPKTSYPYKVISCRGSVEFPVGYDRAGNLITCDLSSGEPHMLIAGETGSGKSTVLRSIITNLILGKKVKMHLIDLKRGAEFQIFAKCGCIKNFARTKAEALAVLTDISKEVDRRYDLFFERDVTDIKEYNRRCGRLGYELLVIDEFADLHQDKESILLLEEIAAKSRACGIHLIISTQRPDHIILNGRIKANVTTILGLKTTNEANSRIIIDSPGLETLRGKGHGIYKRGEKTTVQCPYLTTEDARELLRPLYVEKPKPIEQEVDVLC